MNRFHLSIALFAAAGCVNVADPAFTNPFDPSLPPVLLSIEPVVGGLSVSWELGAAGDSVVRPGRKLLVTRELFLPLCDPAGATVRSCGKPVSLPAVPAEQLLTGPVVDRTLSLPSGPRKVVYSLVLDSGNDTEAAVIATQSWTGSVDLDADQAVGDCDDLNPAIGACRSGMHCVHDKGFRCECLEGFKPVGDICIRNCALDHGGCDPNAACSSDGCLCQNGYVGDGLTCSCPAGKLTCGESCVDTQNDPNNCGLCGRRCTAVNGGAACVLGTCVVATCDEGLDDCDGDVATGCETNLLSDAAHCGRCGGTCRAPHGTPGCSGGSCTVLACEAHWGDCDHDASNGCETNTQLNAEHCDACDAPCTAPQGSARCELGRCIVASCQGTRADCNASASDGCEVELTTDAKHCGACDHSCAVAHGSAACVGGLCGTLVCDPGYRVCGSACVPVDDVNNCGACGHACAANQRCGDGVCTSCPEPGLECDGVCVNLAIDPGNCGSCGTRCDADRTCDVGQCRSCPAPNVTCDRQCVDLQSDVNNCGGCGVTCSATAPSTATCSAGRCLVTLTQEGQPRAVPFGLTLDATKLYWTTGAADHTGERVMSIPLAGGAPSTLSTSLPTPGGIAWASDMLFVTDGNGAVWRRPGSTGVFSTTATSQQTPLAVAADATYVYWANHDDAGAIVRATRAGATPVTLRSEARPWGLAVDTSAVYATSFTGGRVVRTPITGGTSTTLAIGRTFPGQVTFDATSVYWTEESPPKILKVSKSGGAVQTLASPTAPPLGIATDGTNVYWTQGDAVVRVAVGGGTSVTLASGQPGASSIVVDASSVYWTNADLSRNQPTVKMPVMKLTPK